MESLRNKVVLVTGGAGFIGSHLVDQLTLEHPKEIVVVDNFFLGKEGNLKDAKSTYRNLKVYGKDASRYESMKEVLKKHKVEVVFNLAVIPLPTSLVKPYWASKKNVDIAMAMCELCRNEYFDTLIHCSSSEAYGTAAYVPMDEKHPLDPKTPYAASKAACDHLVMSYYYTYGIDAAIVRPFNNYGPRQNKGSYAGVIPLTIRRILNGEQPVIYGDGKQTRDFIYVTDTANAMVNIYKNKKTRGKTLNVASGKEITINKVISSIAKYLEYKGKVRYEPSRPADVCRHLGGVNLAKKLIAFKPVVNFDVGIKRTIEWYKGTKVE